MFTPGIRRSSSRGSHRALWPSRDMTAGTSVMRTRNASAGTPKARDTPIDFTIGSSSSTKPPKTPIMISAAAVTTRPLWPKPVTIDSFARPGRAYDHWVLYGRDAEREQIGLLLRRARESRSGALVVRGEPGIGKSALLEDTRERASDMQILTARPVESESELPFAALHQVVRPILGHVERLPAPQATALRVALGLEEGQTPERFLVFAAGLSLLSELAERRPVLCFVDDAQWLDTASAEALLFVARRLDAEGIIMLFGAREGDVRTFEAPDIPSLALTGLEIDAASMLLTRGATAEIAPAVLDRLVGQAQG